MHILEPIGGAAPKFSARDKINAFSTKMTHTIALDCPAQGYPGPAFRYYPFREMATDAKPVQIDFQNRLAAQPQSFLRRQKV